VTHVAAKETTKVSNASRALRVCFDAVVDAARSGGWQVLVNSLRELSRFDDLDITAIVPQERVEEVAEISRRIQTFAVRTTPRRPLQNLLWHLTQLPHVTARIAPDVLHVPSHNLLVARRVVPTVLTIHDVTEFKLRGHYDPLRTFYRHQIVPRNARLVDHIVTVSDFVAQEIESTFELPRGKISVAHNGIAPDYVPLSSGPRDEYFLYLGQIHLPNKNLLRLVDAYADLLARHPEAPPLLIAGQDVVGLEEVKRRIALKGVISQVRIVGYRPRSELPSLYQRALCLTYVPLREGFGLPVAEAMACGCPVITSNGSSLAEIGEGAAVLVNPYSTASITEAMERVLLSSSLRDELRVKGIERAKRYTWARAASVLRDVYQKVANQKRGQE
jgi:glycosyltransferase involved in cell wall biosynthesis